MVLKGCSSPVTFTTIVICLCPTDTVLSLDVFKRGFLFVSCAKVSERVYTIQPLCRQRVEAEAEKQRNNHCNIWHRAFKSKQKPKNVINRFLSVRIISKPALTLLCCAFRTGQFVYGRWTEVTCAVWPGGPATPTLLAPSPAPGNVPAATRGLSSQARTQRHMGLRKHLCVSLSRMKASFLVSGSQDCTVKVWDLPADLTTTETDIHQLTPRTTEKAHDKVEAQNERKADKEGMILVCLGTVFLFRRSKETLKV